MELSQILNILDNTNLTRTVITIKKNGEPAISYINNTGENITATVNETEYEETSQVCIVSNGETVKLYINNIARFKLESIDLESVLSFSIS